MGKQVLQGLLLFAICVFAFIVLSWLLAMVGVVIPREIWIVIGVIVLIIIVMYVLYGTWR